MKQLDITIQNETGLHARPAKTLVNLVKQFKSDIIIWHGEKKANAKSLISVLTLGASKGSQLRIEIKGEDEETAAAEIEAAILSGLGEGEPIREPQTKPSASPAPKEILLEESKPVKANMLKGVGAAPGIAIGPVYQFQHQEIPINEMSDGLILGWESLQDALARAREQLSKLNHQMIERGLKAEAAIFDAHLGLLEDPELTETVHERIQKGQDA
ncbi:MAG TPA: hypothetical protein DCY14_19040, partial [Anaerolineae bacterium]|nr:hypothetical protein [Anaerolineae bacterium]